ncbi:MAG: hypothetical protein RR444_00035 [Oscillospiraceae bacterium]
MNTYLNSGAFCISLNEETAQIDAIYDKRYSNEVDITDGSGKFGSFSFTTVFSDITKGEKPKYTPYVSQVGEYESMIQTSENGIQLQNLKESVLTELYLSDDEVIIETTEHNASFSEFGLNLALNFMSKKNGEWDTQFLISSPYLSDDRQFCFVFLTRPDGKNLLVVSEHPIDGYKIDYSDYSCGHFFDNLKLLSSFDSAYQLPQKTNRSMKVHIIPVGDYLSALKRVQEIFSVPICYYDVSTDFILEKAVVHVIGNCDSVMAVFESGRQIELSNIAPDTYCFMVEEFGNTKITPFHEGKSGIGCVKFGLDGFKELYTRATNSVKQNYNQICPSDNLTTSHWLPHGAVYVGNANNPDRNLCESQMWANSALRYMRLFGIDQKISNDVKNLLHFIMTTNEGEYLSRITMIPNHDSGYPYNAYGDTRIQEAFNGINILIDAFQLFQEREYLEFAVTALSAILNYQLMPSGEIRRYEYKKQGNHSDYTTVTCMVIPVVNLANLLKAQNDTRYIIFQEAAKKIADFIVTRGFDFPTEGSKSEKVNGEMEDGSISCSALTVLYVAMNLKLKESYLEFAKEILQKHDAYSVRVHDSRMYGSSLRWWETIWEGDFNGPSICCGHAWTIWRAEAQYYYGLLVKDSQRLLDSYNAYMSNFSQCDKDGNMFAIYQCESICGGGDYKKSEQVEFAITTGFPKKYDNSLSRYVFARAYETWFRCTAIIGKNILNGTIIKDNNLVSFAPDFKLLYIDDFSGDLVINTDSAITVITKTPYHSESIITKTQYGDVVLPFKNQGTIKLTF